MSDQDVETIRASLLAANEDVYGDEGNVDAFAALERIEQRLAARAGDVHVHLSETP